MTTRKNLAVVAILAALACTGLHAQSVDMRADISFDFQAGGRLLPAGEYLIHTHDGVVVLRGEDSHSPSAMFLTIRTERGGQGEGRLEFNRYGSEYFLAKIWNPVTQDGSQVLQTNREKELAKHGAPGPAAVALASSK